MILNIYNQNIRIKIIIKNNNQNKKLKATKRIKELINKFDQKLLEVWLKKKESIL